MVSSVSSFVQRAATRALKEDVAPARDVYRGRRNYVLARLREIGLDVVGSYRRCRCGRRRHHAAMFRHRSAPVLRCCSWRFCCRRFQWWHQRSAGPMRRPCIQISHAELAIWRDAGLVQGWFGARPACWAGAATRRTGAVAYRIGAAVFGLARLRVRKGENGASLQAEIRGLPPFSNSANFSHLGFCENTACESHYCSCIGALDSVILGPIVAFSANSGSTICNEAPLWRFLPTSFAVRFRWDFRLGFSRALLRRALARLWLGAFLRRIAARDSWSLSHDLLRRLAIDVPQRKSRVCAWARVSSCSAISCLRLD